MIFPIDNPENVFITSDQHFGHANIIKYTNRPFKDVEEMDEKLTDNWNEVVPHDAIVFHLGDFTLGDRADAYRYFRDLHGRIKVLGTQWHHDQRWLPAPPWGLGLYSDMRWDGGCPVQIIEPLVMVTVPNWGEGGHPLAITLCHYPLAVWDRKHYGAWHLHGHSHGQYQAPEGEYILDVGVDCTDYKPVSLLQVAEKMKEKGWLDG